MSRLAHPRLLSSQGTVAVDKLRNAFEAKHALTKRQTSGAQHSLANLASSLSSSTQEVPGRIDTELPRMTADPKNDTVALVLHLIQTRSTLEILRQVLHNIDSHQNLLQSRDLKRLLEDLGIGDTS